MIQHETRVRRGEPREAGRVPGRTSILHIIDELKVGGAQTHLLTMLRQGAVSHPEVEHRVLSLFGDGAIGEALRREGIPVEVLDLRSRLARHRYLKAAGAIEEVLRAHRPDIVEAHLTWSRLLGLYAAWRAGVPRRIGFEQGDIYLNSWKFRVANHLGQHFADRIVVCSRALADWNRRTHGISRDRLAVLHNCVDLARFRPESGEGAPQRAAFGFPAGSTIFGAVGTLGRGVNKRVDVTIRALAEANKAGCDAALVICGDGEQRADLEALAESLRVGPRVRFLGTRDDIPAVLAACDVLCHAAPFEPFGIVCIEAMAMGLPVLVPDSGGIREAVDDGVTGFLYPALDHRALARLMARMHGRRDMLRTMGRSARRAAEERFSVGRYVDRLYDSYGFPARTREVATP